MAFTRQSGTLSLVQFLHEIGYKSVIAKESTS